LTAPEIAYLEELPSEGFEHYGRHHCPVPGCESTARYGNVTCGPCWLRVPWSKARHVIAAFKLRAQRPDLWAAACHVALQLAVDYSEAECHRRTSHSAPTRRTTPESDPAPHRRTA
jgi:hypothetical protein